MSLDSLIYCMSGTVGGRSPEFFWVLPKRSIPKPDTHGKDAIQRESLGTDMLYELMNSNYTRYYIEVINMTCSWSVSFHPVVGSSIIT